VGFAIRVTVLIRGGTLIVNPLPCLRDRTVRVRRPSLDAISLIQSRINRSKRAGQICY